MSGTETETEIVYPNAPIREAIIDIRVAEIPQTDLPKLKGLFDSVREDYPDVDDYHMFTGEVQIGATISTSATSKQAGYLFFSEDKKNIFQARNDGFTLSRFNPYQKWADFSKEAKRLWAIYAQISDALQITRIAVRFVNRIDIPQPVNDFGEYFRTLPQISPDLPQGVSQFFMQVQIPSKINDSSVIINQAIVPPSSPDKLSVVLDIDAFKEGNFGSADEELWGMFDDLRKCKNKTFESCITDKARDLFK